MFPVKQAYSSWWFSDEGCICKICYSDILFPERRFPNLFSKTVFILFLLLFSEDSLIWWSSQKVSRGNFVKHCVHTFISAKFCSHVHDCVILLLLLSLLSYNSCQLDFRYTGMETEIWNYLFEILSTYLKTMKKETQQSDDKPKLESGDWLSF